MSDTTDLNDAYEKVIAAEKALVTELATVAEDFKARLAEIKNRQPRLGASSAARQFLSRVEANMNSVFSYDLDAVKNTYGMNSAAAPNAAPDNNAVQTANGNTAAPEAPAE